MKKILPLLLLCALLLSACAGSAGSSAPAGDSGAVSASEAPADRTVITLNGADVQISGGGARDTGSEIVISAAGTYEVRGVGQEKALVVDTGDDAMDVTVILNSAEIVCLSGPALHVRQAKHFRLQLAEGSQNRLVSGTEEMLQALDPEATGAALYSEDDMDIEGTGSLIVCGYLNNGIACKDDLDLNSGEIAVVAANNGVKGNDSVQVKGGSLTISAWGDGVTGSSKALKATGDLLLDGCDVQLESLTDGARSESGSVSVSAGSLTVCAGGDGIQAGEKDSGLGDISISGGTLEIHAGKQAVKARGSFAVSGGSVLALCGSEKQAGPAKDLPWLLCRISGQTGDSVSAGSLSLTARLDYACLLVVDGSLSRGETVSVTNGSSTVEATVN